MVNLKYYRSYLSVDESLPLAFWLIVLSECVVIVFGNASFPISQAGEDGSFYIQIAHNLATLGYPTFDGIAPTTGVHWLWLLILASLFRLVHANDPETMFRVAGLAYFLLLAAAGIVIQRITKSWVPAIIMVAYLANRGHWYMETHLVLLTLALAIRSPSPLTGFLIVAARTDMVLFALFSRQRNLIPGAILGFVWVCLINAIVDGNPISVSAQIKSAGFNDWDTIIRTAGHLAKYYFPILEIACFFALFSADRWFVAALGLLTIHILHNSETEGWYLAPLFLTSLLCAHRFITSADDKVWYLRRHMGIPRVYQ